MKDPSFPLAVALFDSENTNRFTEVDEETKNKYLQRARSFLYCLKKYSSKESKEAVIKELSE